MKLTPEQKRELQDEIVSCLSAEDEVRRIVIFGSFVHSDDPEDVDVAVFQDSQDGYLPLALKYRRMTRPVARRIPLNIIPLRSGIASHRFANEVEQGITIYVR